MQIPKLFSQHKKRQIIVAKLYQYLLEQPDKKIFEQELNHDLNSGNLTKMIIATINDILWYQDSLVNEINQHLKSGWIFANLKAVEKAILLLATYELLYTKTQKAIIINEAVILTKEYCNENSYRYINGILDKIKKQHHNSC